MADTSNLTKFLGDVADAIRTKKETTDKIPAEQFDQEILSIETGSGNIPVKLFETEEQMQADETAEEGDLALVYREEIQNASVDSKFSSATFPNTVVLDTAITDYVEVRYRAVDDSAMFDCWGQLDPEYFMMDCYTENSEVRIQYESSDGKTYTRIDDGDELVDFGTEIYYYRPEYWNDAIGYFIQTGGNTFDGLYKYGSYQDENYYHFFTGFRVENNDLVCDYSDEVYIKDITQTIYDIWKDNYTLGLYELTAKFYDMVDGIPTKVDIYQNLGSIPRICGYATLNNDKLFLSNGAFASSTTPTTKKNVSKCTIDLVSKTIINTETITSTAVSVPNETNSWIHIIDDVDSSALYTVLNLYTELDTNWTYSYVRYQFTWYYGGSSSVGSGKSKTATHYGYLFAPTQLTLSDASQLLPGKIAYGKTGAIEGDGSISNHMISLSKDVFGNNETLVPQIINTELNYDGAKKYTLCENNAADICFGLNETGDISSSYGVFYRNGVKCNYYLDGDYYYVAKLSTDTLTIYELDKQYKILNTYSIAVTGITTSLDANKVVLTKYNDLWHLFFTTGAGSSKSFYYEYGIVNLNDSTYTKKLSATKSMYSTSYTTNLAVDVSMYGNKIGFGAKQAYRTSSSGKFSYRGFIAYINLDTGVVTTILDNSTLLSSISSSYSGTVKLAMNDKYLAYHGYYYDASYNYGGYCLSYNFSTGEKVTSYGLYNDSAITTHFSSISYLGADYAWTFHGYYAVRLRLDNGKADAIKLDHSITGIDETGTYGITGGAIYRFDGDTYTIEELPLATNINDWYFTKIVQTDEYFAILGITKSRIYWYTKMVEDDVYDIVIQKNSNSSTATPIIPYFTSPSFKNKLKEVYFGKVYEDTISPAEYDTALETAQDILGKEVTE